MTSKAAVGTFSEEEVICDYVEPLIERSTSSQMPAVGDAQDQPPAPASKEVVKIYFTSLWPYIGAGAYVSLSA